MLYAITHAPSLKLQHCKLTFLQSEPINIQLACIQHQAFPSALSLVKNVDSINISECVKAEVGLA